MGFVKKNSYIVALYFVRTSYYNVYMLIRLDKLRIVPVKAQKSFEDAVEKSWKEYKEGKFTDHHELKKNYTLKSK